MRFSRSMNGAGSRRLAIRSAVDNHVYHHPKGLVREFSGRWDQMLREKDATIIAADFDCVAFRLVVQWMEVGDTKKPLVRTAPRSRFEWQFSEERVASKDNTGEIVVIYPKGNVYKLQKVCDFASFLRMEDSVARVDKEIFQSHQDLVKKQHPALVNKCSYDWNPCRQRSVSMSMLEQPYVPTPWRPAVRQHYDVPEPLHFLTFSRLDHQANADSHRLAFLTGLGFAYIICLARWFIASWILWVVFEKFTPPTLMKWALYIDWTTCFLFIIMLALLLRGTAVVRTMVRC